MLRALSTTTTPRGSEAGQDHPIGRWAGRGRRCRRGATAMEYLVAASFVLVVLILAVQHLGDLTRALFATSAKATSTNQNPTP